MSGLLFGRRDFIVRWPQFQLPTFLNRIWWGRPKNQHFVKCLKGGVAATLYLFLLLHFFPTNGCAVKMAWHPSDTFLIFLPHSRLQHLTWLCYYSCCQSCCCCFCCFIHFSMFCVFSECVEALIGLWLWLSVLLERITKYFFMRSRFDVIQLTVNRFLCI